MYLLQEYMESMQETGDKSEVTKFSYNQWNYTD